MFFIELTYAKPPKAYGSMAGPTDKKFLLDVYSIESITQYNESTKLTLKSGKEVEVVETRDYIVKKMKRES